MSIMVGQLIDELEPFRGRGDHVVVEDELGRVYKILGIDWDDVAKVVVIDVEEKCC